MSDDEEMSDGGIVIPTIPRPPPKALKETMEAFSTSFSQSYSHPTEPEASGETGKRPSDELGEGESAKRQKGSDGQAVTTKQVGTAEETTAAGEVLPAVGYSIFSVEDLAHPTVPDKSAIERMILLAKKRQLRAEYVGSSN